MMEAGRYYVGDLCYVIKNELWSNVCMAFWDTGRDGGQFIVEGIGKFSMFSTMYGDGEYQGSEGVYSVDSGTIGCIRLDQEGLKQHIDEKEMRDLGNIVDFPGAFMTDCEDGVMVFGHITINTNDEEDEEYYWYDECDDEYDEED